MHTVRWGFAACMALMVGGSLAMADTPQEILEKVRKKYDSIRDAELRFAQRNRFPLAKLEQHAGGILYVKKENKYRIEMEDQTVVTDGTTVWSYSVPNKQVLIDRFKLNERTLSPDRILAGAPGDFTVTAPGRESLGTVEVVVLKLVPRGEQSLVSSLRLWVDPGEWLIRKAELIDVNGKQTSYTMSEYKLNVGVPDSRFIFQIPEGVEVVDLR